MNKTLLTCILLLGLMAGCGEGTETASRSVAPPDESFAALDPYGVWMNVAGLGTVWQPAVPYDWRPFADGQWVWTDRGWMWLTDEPFGWIVYHYGYWTHWGAAGWLWVPGYEWSPARVQWYAGPDLIGWAPMPPPMPSTGQTYVQEENWVVVPANNFTREHVGRYRTTTRDNFVAPRAQQQRPPEIESVRRATNQEVKRRSTEGEDVRRGGRTLQNVRVREEATTMPVTPPVQVVTPPAQVTPPPPAAKPSPQPPQEKVRQSGQTRTPAATKAAPAKTKTPATKSRTTERPATREGVSPRQQKPDSARTPAPRREERR